MSAINSSSKYWGSLLLWPYRPNTYLMKCRIPPFPRVRVWKHEMHDWMWYSTYLGFFTWFLSFFAFQGLLSTTYILDILFRVDNREEQGLSIFLKAPPKGKSFRRYKEVCWCWKLQMSNSWSACIDILGKCKGNCNADQCFTSTTTIYRQQLYRCSFKQSHQHSLET